MIKLSREVQVSTEFAAAISTGRPELLEPKKAWYSKVTKGIKGTEVAQIIELVQVLLETINNQNSRISELTEAIEAAQENMTSIYYLLDGMKQDEHTC